MKKLIKSLIFLSMFLPITSHALTFIWDYTQNDQKIAENFKLYTQKNCTETPVTILIPSAQPTGSFSQSFSHANSNYDRNTNYCAFVTALAADGEESTPSNTVQFQVLSPNSPTNLRVN